MSSDSTKPNTNNSKQQQVKTPTPTPTPKPEDEEEEEEMVLLDDGSRVPAHPHPHTDQSPENNKSPSPSIDKDASAGMKGVTERGTPVPEDTPTPPLPSTTTATPALPTVEISGDTSNEPDTTSSAPGADLLQPSSSSLPTTPQSTRPISPSSIPVSFSANNLRTSNTTNRPPVHRQVIFDQWYGKMGKETGGVVRMREFDNVDVEGAVCMHAFPSQGFTSLILGQHLIDSLSLPLLGVLTSPLLPLKSIIQNSEPMHSIRVHGDRRVVVFTGEGKVERDEVQAGLVEAVLDFMKRHRLRLLLTVEGLPVSTNPSSPQSQPGILRLKQGEEDEEGAQKIVADLDLEAVRKEKAKWLGTDPGFCGVMEEMGLDQISEGVVSGLTGGLLSEALLEPLYLACLLVPATSLFPDASSAVTALNIIKKFVPALKDVETEKLEARAKETEEAVLGLVKALQGGLAKELAPPRNLYG